MLHEDKLRESFPHFLSVAFRMLDIGKPLRAQYRLAEFLQYGGPRQLVLAYRGMGKSIIGGALVDWEGWKDRDRLALIRSGTGEKAKDFIHWSRQILDRLPFLQEMVPAMNTTDGAYRFEFGGRSTVSKDPSVSAYGIFSMATGSHPHRLIDDDTETAENSRTIEARKKLKKKLAEAEVLLLPGGRHLVIGTYQTMESVYRDYEETHEVFDVPAQYPRRGEDKKLRRLAPFLQEDLRREPSLHGEPTSPERFPSILLDQQRGVMGESEFQLHMNNDPSLSDANRFPLRLRDLIVMPVSPELAPDQVVWGPTKQVQIDCPGLNDDGFYEPMFVSNQFRPYQDSICYIDPSGRGKDETAWYIGHALNGTIFVSGGGGRQDGTSEQTMSLIAQQCHKAGVHRVLVERNFGDGMWSQLLKPHLQRAGCRAQVIDDPVTGQKELRILNSLEPSMGLHRLVFDPSVARDEELCYQISHLTRDRGCLPRDDRVEALAGLVRAFAPLVAVDAASRAEKQRLADKAKELLEYEKNWKKPGWDGTVSRVLHPGSGLPAPNPKTRRTNRSFLGR